MPQSSMIKSCLICGEKFDNLAWTHIDNDQPNSVHVRSEIEEELTVVHYGCASMMRKVLEGKKELKDVVTLLR